MIGDKERVTKSKKMNDKQQRLKSRKSYIHKSMEKAIYTVREFV